MIDGLKITYNAPETTHLKTFDFWETLVNAKTLKRVTDHYTSELRGLKMKLTDRTHLAGYRFEVRGSINKYLNNGKDNAGRFEFADLVQSIDSLTEFTGVPANKFTLHGLEIGLNIPLPYSPNRILKNLVSYGNKPFTWIDPKTKQIGMRAKLTQYEIKVYDKGRQSNKPDNILRFEVSVNKMEFLKKYGLRTLADLQDVNKVYPLITVLIEAAKRIVWTDNKANFNQMTDREQKKFLFYSNPKAWGQMNKDRRKYHRRQWLILLKKYGKRYDLETTVFNTWNRLFSSQMQAEKLPPFDRLKEKMKAGKITTFLPFIYRGKKGEITEPKTDPKQISFRNNIKPKKDSMKNVQKKRKFCASCGNEITHQKKGSRFCSKKYAGKIKAKQCRNKDSNKRLAKRRKIKRAMKNNKFLAINYRDDHGILYTDILHPKEIDTDRQSIDRITDIKNFTNGKKYPNIKSISKEIKIKHGNKD